MVDHNQIPNRTHMSFEILPEFYIEILFEIWDEELSVGIPFFFREKVFFLGGTGGSD